MKRNYGGSGGWKGGDVGVKGGGGGDFCYSGHGEMCGCADGEVRDLIETYRSASIM